MPDFDLDSALLSPLPWIVGDRHLNTEETAVVQAVMQVMVSRFGATIESCRAVMVRAGVRIEMEFGGEGVDYRRNGGIDKLLDDMTEAAFSCQQRERQMRNLSVGIGFVKFYLYR